MMIAIDEAIGVDDKLNAIDEFTEAFNAYFMTETLRAEVEAQLEIEAIPTGYSKYDAERE